MGLLKNMIAKAGREPIEVPAGQGAAPEDMAPLQLDAPVSAPAETSPEAQPNPQPSRPVRAWDLPDAGGASPSLAPSPAPRPAALSEPAPPAGPSRQDMAREAMAILQAREAAASQSGAPSPLAPPDAAPQPGGRVKTRLLGFSAAGAAEADPFETGALSAAQASAQAAPEASDTTQARFPVGWLVVVDGPGTGAFFTLFSGVSQIGRGADQAVRLDFGDSAISRENHAALAYDPEQNAYFLGHGGKANIVRLNGQPVLSTERLTGCDEIRIGETTLRFLALCDEGFAWQGGAAGSNPEGGVV